MIAIVVVVVTTTIVVMTRVIASNKGKDGSLIF